MKLISTKYRTNQSEIMDDFAMEGEELRDALDKIANVNRFLGGNSLTLDGVQRLLESCDPLKPVTIVDVGCGNGDMLRILSDYGARNGLSFKLIGIDANNFTIRHAKLLSVVYPNIHYRCEDVFGESFKQLEYDIVLCTLTLHHFEDDAILDLLALFKEKASIGIVINDLHRSAFAYRCFQLFCSVFGLNHMSRNDGLISILRGFKKKDLLRYSKQLSLEKYFIRWKWAFRYEWIIPTTQSKAKQV